MTLTVLNQGDFFGEMSLFDKKPRSATAQVVGEAELRFISSAEFDGMISDPFARHMLVKLSERLRHVDEALTKLDSENVVTPLVSGEPQHAPGLGGLARRCVLSGRMDAPAPSTR